MTNHDDRSTWGSATPTTPYSAPSGGSPTPAPQPQVPATVPAQAPGWQTDAVAAQPAQPWGGVRRDDEVIVRTVSEYRAPGWAHVPPSFGSGAPWAAETGAKRRPRWFWPIIVSAAAFVALVGGGVGGFAIGHSIGGGSSHVQQGGTSQLPGGTSGGTSNGFPGGNNGGTSNGFSGGSSGSGSGSGLGGGSSSGSGSSGSGSSSGSSGDGSSTGSGASS